MIDLDERAVEVAAKALAEDYRWKWDALKERDSEPFAGDRYTLRRSARAALEAALLHLPGVRLSEAECFEAAIALEFYGRKMADSDTLSNAAESAQAKLRAELARLRAEGGKG